MKHFLLIVNLLAFSLLSHSQNIDIQGKILSDKSKLPVPSVKVIRLDSLFDVQSDRNGFFKIAVPETGKTSLLFSHPDFVLLTKEINPEQIHAPLMISLIPIIKKSDSLVFKYRKAVSFMPVELLNGAIAFRYEHFLQPKNSMGLNASFYVFGFIHPVSPVVYYNYDADFKGIKLGLFYRYYLWRNNDNGGFVEIRPQAGYFNFTYKGKKSTSSIVYEPEQLLIIGGSTAFGLSFIPGGKRVIVNLSLGFQYFPAHFEGSIPDEYGHSSDFNNGWWKWGGPGSYIEFKLSVGGLF